jgi:uncharacterized membrane protein YcaP (DUF421 family)
LKNSRFQFNQETQISTNLILDDEIIKKNLKMCQSKKNSKKKRVRIKTCS